MGGRGAPPPGGNGGGNENGDDNGSVIDHLPQGEMEEEMVVMVVMVVMMVMMEMMVEEMILHHHQIKHNHDAAKIGKIDGYMWCKDHPNPQANQGKMEGMDGWTNTSIAQVNDKCPRSGTHSSGYYRFRKFL